MRYVYLPDNLTAVQLLDFRQCPAYHQQALEDIATDQVLLGNFPEALTALDLLIGDATQVQVDANTRALALVLKAEVFRRQGRWYEAVVHVHYALNIMEFQFTTVEKYNQGIAVYTEGLCHLCMQSQAAMTETFNYAQPLLHQAEEHWHFAKEYEREYACNDLLLFMQQLQNAAKLVAVGTPAVFMPVYEIRNGVFIRSDAIALDPSQYSLRLDVTSTPTSDVIMLNPEVVSLVTLSLTATYVGLRSTEQGEADQLEAPGDLTIVEILPQDNHGYTDGIPEKVHKLSRELGFTKTCDGRIIYNAQIVRLPGSAWLVSPHLLIRKEALL